MKVRKLSIKAENLPDTIDFPTLETQIEEFLEDLRSEIDDPSQIDEEQMQVRQSRVVDFLTSLGVPDEAIVFEEVNIEDEILKSLESLLGDSTGDNMTEILRNLGKTIPVATKAQGIGEALVHTFLHSKGTALDRLGYMFNMLHEVWEEDSDLWKRLDVEPEDINVRLQDEVMHEITHGMMRKVLMEIDKPEEPKTHYGIESVLDKAAEHFREVGDDLSLTVLQDYIAERQAA